MIDAPEGLLPIGHCLWRCATRQMQVYYEKDASVPWETRRISVSVDAREEPVGAAEEWLAFDWCVTLRAAMAEDWPLP